MPHITDQFYAATHAKDLVEQVLDRKSISAMLDRFCSFSPTELALLQVIALHSSLRGARLLQLLITHPGRKHSALLLSGILSGICSSCWLELPASTEAGAESIPPVLQPSFMIFEAAIPSTDPRTMKAVRQRLKDLEAQTKVGAKHPARQAALRKECRALKHYLSQVSAPNGNIRAFPGGDRKAYQSLARSLQRFLALIALSAPDLADYATQNLVMGRHFGWKCSV